MAHFQDKLCNVLTFVGLVGVIVWGTASLWPEAEATPLLQPEEEDLLTEPSPLDTLPELPMVEDQPVGQEEVMNDTVAPDTVALEDISCDTLVHSAASHHSATSPQEKPTTQEEEPETTPAEAK